MTTKNVPTASAPVPDAQGAFSGDAGVNSLREAARGYLARLRGGETGALPALFGVIVMLVIFSRASPVFMRVGNLANLPAQGAAIALIAMGLVFVLLLGEIDLSAGTGSGVSAAIMAIALIHSGDVHKALATPTFVAVVAMFGVAAVLAARARLWIPVAAIVLGAVLLVTNSAGNALAAIYVGTATGITIGVLTGYLVARVRIPSFVVTLALFLAWQGVLLKFIGLGNALPVRNFTFVDSIANKNLDPILGWIFFLVVLGGYGAFTVIRSLRRAAAGLSADPLSLVVVRVLFLGVLGALAVAFLNRERSPNPALTSIKGMPYVLPGIIVLMIFWTLVLTKTAFGRHLYAVGGNREAARRAGIDVPRMQIAAFAICSGMAALGGIVSASKLGGVPADAGGGNVLLYAVGAAVIGGTSLFGGRGKVRDAVLGAIVIAMIPNGLGLIRNLDSSVNFIVTGVVLLVAASVDALTRTRSATS